MWKAPVDENERKFYPLTMDNQCCKRCIANNGALVDYCVLNEDNQREKKVKAISFLQEAMDVSCKKTPFSNHEIEEFQDLVDYFSQKWLDLTSLPRMGDETKEELLQFLTKPNDLDMAVLNAETATI